MLQLLPSACCVRRTDSFPSKNKSAPAGLPAALPSLEMCASADFLHSAAGRADLAVPDGRFFCSNRKQSSNTARALHEPPSWHCALLCSVRWRFLRHFQLPGGTIHLPAASALLSYSCNKRIPPDWRKYGRRPKRNTCNGRAAIRALIKQNLFQSPKQPQPRRSWQKALALRSSCARSGRTSC